MGYYDNVKDDVKESDDTSKPNFDTLRKAAEESSESEEEREGDDTDIEILEDGLNRDSSGNSSSSGLTELGAEDSSDSSASEAASSEKTRERSAASTSSNVSADTSGIEEKLDKIIEQNERMIDILESFGS